MFFSLLVARLITPVVAAFVLKSDHLVHEDGALMRRYLILLRWVVAHRWKTLGVALVIYAASIGVTRLEAHIAPDNHASRHVAEAAGFTQADTFTDRDGTEFIRYARDASGDGAAPFTKLGPDPRTDRTGRGSGLG